MNLSKNTKEQLISRCVERWGQDFKTPLAKALEVDVSTVRRMFNQRNTVKKRDLLAINSVLDNDS